ncbi:hypothetical protein BDR26DRAFT_871428 [Obelidium mucronatum]|nr:hypothetical protein BDR26DRAFT_871428 [Obelidium mucronatum]
METPAHSPASSYRSSQDSYSMHLTSHLVNIKTGRVRMRIPPESGGSAGVNSQCANLEWDRVLLDLNIDTCCLNITSLSPAITPTSVIRVSPTCVHKTTTHSGTTNTPMSTLMIYHTTAAQPILIRNHMDHKMEEWKTAFETAIELKLQQIIPPSLPRKATKQSELQQQQQQQQHCPAAVPHHHSQLYNSHGSDSTRSVTSSGLVSSLPSPPPPQPPSLSIRHSNAILQYPPLRKRSLRKIHPFSYYNVVRSLSRISEESEPITTSASSYSFKSKKKPDEDEDEDRGYDTPSSRSSSCLSSSSSSDQENDGSLVESKHVSKQQQQQRRHRHHCHDASDDGIRESVHRRREDKAMSFHLQANVKIRKLGVDLEDSRDLNARLMRKLDVAVDEVEYLRVMVRQLEVDKKRRDGLEATAAAAAAAGAAVAGGVVGQNGNAVTENTRSSGVTKESEDLIKELQSEVSRLKLAVEQGIERESRLEGQITSERTKMANERRLSKEEIARVRAERASWVPFEEVQDTIQKVELEKDEEVKAVREQLVRDNKRFTDLNALYYDLCDKHLQLESSYNSLKSGYEKELHAHKTLARLIRDQIVPLVTANTSPQTSQHETLSKHTVLQRGGVSSSSSFLQQTTSRLTQHSHQVPENAIDSNQRLVTPGPSAEGIRESTLENGHDNINLAATGFRIDILDILLDPDVSVLLNDNSSIAESSQDLESEFEFDDEHDLSEWDGRGFSNQRGNLMVGAQTSRVEELVSPVISLACSVISV